MRVAPHETRSTYWVTIVWRMPIFAPVAWLLKGDARAALAEFQQEPVEAWRLVGLALANYALDRKAESDAALDELVGKYEQTMAYQVAYVLAYRGEADRAFEWARGDQFANYGVRPANDD